MDEAEEKEERRHPDSDDDYHLLPASTRSNCGLLFRGKADQSVVVHLHQPTTV
jgi:hypothetical protein